MTVDYNYWKDAYKSSWAEAANKEKLVKEIIEDLANCNCEYVGLGAGSTEYIYGSASSNEHTKGGSDLLVSGTNINIEVTGPNVSTVGKYADLWLRPDKIQYAIDNPNKNCWVLHVLKKEFLIRAICLNEEFCEAYKNEEFKIVHPFIRGRRESYSSIPANSRHIVEVDDLISNIKSTLHP